MTITELRKYRIAGMAIFDWVFSLLGMYLLGRYVFHFHGYEIWIVWVIFWILFGVLAHYIFRIPSMFGYYIGTSVKPIH